MGFHMPPRHVNGDISAAGDPIHFMFGSRVTFTGSADRMALFPVSSNPGWRPAAILDNFEWPYLRNGSFDPDPLI